MHLAQATREQNRKLCREGLMQGPDYVNSEVTLDTTGTLRRGGCRGKKPEVLLLRRRQVN